MPTYDYKCLSCGIKFEHFQSMKDDQLVKCNKCGGELKRLIGAGAGPIFKGTGFYQTDYKNNGKKTSDSKPITKTPDSKKVDAKKETTKKVVITFDDGFKNKVLLHIRCK